MWSYWLQKVLVTLALGLLIIEYLQLSAFAAWCLLYQSSSDNLRFASQARKSPSCLRLWSIRRGCYGEEPRQLFHDDWCHPSHFHLPFKAVGKRLERANRLCRHDAILKKCCLALDKLAASFCLFPSCTEISWSIMISFPGSSLSCEIGIVMFVNMEISRPLM